jgi:hypothetical protein
VGGRDVHCIGGLGAANLYEGRRIAHIQPTKLGTFRSRPVSGVSTGVSGDSRGHV